jgi:hypothetical protein
MDTLSILKSNLLTENKNLGDAIHILKNDRLNEKYFPWVHFKLIDYYTNIRNFIDAREYLLEIEPRVNKKYLQFHSLSYNICSSEGWKQNPIPFFQHIADTYEIDNLDERWKVNFLLKVFLISDISDNQFLKFLVQSNFSTLIINTSLLFKKIITNIKREIENTKYQFVIFSCGAASLDGEISDKAFLIVDFNIFEINCNFDSYDENHFDVCIESLALLLRGMCFVEDGGWSVYKKHDGAIKLANLLLWSKACDKYSRLSGIKSRYKFKGVDFNQDLLVRGGNVEFWAIRDFLIDNGSTIKEATEAIENSNRAIETSTNICALNSWPKIDPKNNWLRLITNAGFYSKDKFDIVAINEFIQNYLMGLELGKLFSVYQDELYILARLGLKINKNQIVEWHDSDFIANLSVRKNILFVTSFGNTLNARWEDGLLRDFWLAMEWPLHEIEKLTCIESPSSIWPYQPHASWEETFSYLKALIDQSILNFNHDYFIASCGSYSIPLATYVQTKYKIKAIAFGHYINLFFGIYSNAFIRSPYLNKVGVDSHLWFHSDLASRYPSIVTLDDGKYIS